MLAIINTATVCGLESVPITVEVDVAKMSFPNFAVVGLPDKAIDEAKERVRTAIKNSGADFPQHRITVNLAPADLPKNGPSFDLPIALGLLVASEQIPAVPTDSWFAGELSLNGSLRPINGALAIAQLAKQSGAVRLYVPEHNATEAALIPGLEVFGVQSLQQIVLHLTGTTPLQPVPATPLSTHHHQPVDIDMQEVLGQEQAKRALEIAAAGGHNLLMHGLPGSGKTMLAKAFAGILPAMSVEESLEISTIFSICGLLRHDPYVTRRPFRAPHHTTSDIGLIGGGANPKPGEISLAHHGVLFLDEFPEFPRHVLEALRQPMEDGVVTVSRAKASYTFPARFQLLAAQNPCPCGHFGDPHTACTCTARQITTYQKRISGPLLDRIDIFIHVPRVKEQYLNQPNKSKSPTSAEIRQNVEIARQAQAKRFKNEPLIHTNAAMSTRLVRQFCTLGDEQQQLMSLATSRYHLSARSYFKVLKVARTIADLDKAVDISAAHLSEAIQFRQAQSLSMPSMVH